MSWASNLQNDDVHRRLLREFAASIREAAGSPTVAVVRVTPHVTAAGTHFHNAEAWTYNFASVVLDVAEQLAVVRLLLGRRPDIDWSVAHDYHLDAFMLRRSPAATMLGGRPPVDRTFGGRDPVFLPRTIPNQRTGSEAA
jgi:hypothetical protein